MRNIKTFIAVAISSFIIVYSITLFLNKEYEYSINKNTNLTINNEIEIKEEKNESKKNKKIEEQVQEKNIEEIVNKEEVVTNEEKNNIEQEIIIQEQINTIEEQIEENSNKQDIVNYAVQFVGNPYVMGGNSLTNGTDCSGFVMLIYQNFNIQLPRTPSEQANVGSSISIENIDLGDIVTYGYNGYATHSALYIGDSKVVHAATPSQGIIYGSLYMMPIIQIRRVI